MIKKCEICGKDFKTLPAGHSRKYCFQCSPSYSKGESRTKSIITLRKAMKKEAIKRKGGKCEKCGYSKSLAALQFHHINPSLKKFGLSQNGNTHSWEEYWNEAQKCILLCANCHAEQHEKI